MIAAGLTIQRIAPSDADELSKLCVSIYDQFYTYLWNDDGRWYKHYAYAPEVLAGELQQPMSHFYWLVYHYQKIGYLKVNFEVAYPELMDQRCVELERIYLLKEFTGMGIGKQAIGFCTDLARADQADYLVLKSMDSSSANKHYAALGFECYTSTRLSYEQMKPEYRGMHVWRLKL